MMKLLKSMIVATLVTALFLVGMYSGIRLQYKETLEDIEKSYNIQQTIAVVNLDIGVKQADNSVKNYSSAIIDGLDDSYVLVSAAMAENGYSSGKYGAVLTFPSNLSEAIESINTKEPYSAQVEFKVNSNLPQERYINIYTKLLTLQTQINESFNYMYMESVLEEFHNAQDYVDELLKNNIEMIEAITAVKLGDYSAYMETAAIPKGEYEPKTLPIDSFVEHASQYSDSISKLYLSSYAVAQKDFDKIEDDMKLRAGELNNMAEIWTEDMEKWADETQKYTREVAEYVKAVDTFHEELSVWSDKLSEWNGLSKQYSEDIEKYKTDISQWAKEVLDYGNALSEFCESTEKYYSSQLLEQNVDKWNDWKNKVNEIYQDEMNNSGLYKAYGEEAKKVMEEYADRKEKIADWSEYTKDYQEYLATWETSVNEYYDTITLSDEKYEESKEVYDQYLLLLDEREALVKEKELLVADEITEINTEIANINARISEYNESVRKLQEASTLSEPVMERLGTEVTSADDLEELDMMEDFTLPDELKDNIMQNNTNLLELAESMETKQEEVTEWLESYKILTDNVPVYEFEEIQPETIDKIDTRNFSKAENNLRGLITHEDLDLNVPDDISIIIYDEEMPQPEFAELPKYVGIVQPDDVSVEKPELTEVPPEYSIEDEPVKPKAILETTELINQLAASYNPEDYLNEKVTGQISGIIGQYGNYLESVNQSIESNQKVNIGLLSKNYTEYSIYLSELKTQIYQLHKEEQDRLTAGIDGFVNRTSAIASESESYIGSFARKLPYTRNNSVTNKLFIETAVASLKFNNGNVAVQQNKVTESNESEKLMKASAACGVLLAVLVMIGISVWIVQRKKNVNLCLKGEA
ncbi:MAG: hypothetical protein PUF12_01565 [Thermoflexaceae bacterium]|nr:hypothetical protein [Thermoflexaceae bacterium]